MLITDTIILGAGPIGLELAVALARSGVSYIHIEKGQIGETITWFPPLMQFFSSADRIAIAGVPIPLVDRSKCTREEYLAYLRGIVLQFGLEIRTYEEATAVRREGDAYTVETRTASGAHRYQSKRVVFATGDMARPRLLGIPGEDLPHVTHYFGEPHRYFRKNVLVIGGKNSAVEAALRCHNIGARVSVSYRKSALSPKSVKSWLLPEFEGRIARHEIVPYPGTEALGITPGQVTLRRIDDGSVFDVPADFVLALTGYVADTSLLRSLGIRFQAEGDAPEYDPKSMETSLPCIFVAGTVVAGTQTSFSVFIENCHVHVARIASAITGQTSGVEAPEFEQPES